MKKLLSEPKFFYILKKSRNKNGSFGENYCVEKGSFNCFMQVDFYSEGYVNRVNKKTDLLHKVGRSRKGGP